MQLAAGPMCSSAPSHMTMTLRKPERDVEQGAHGLLQTPLAAHVTYRVSKPRGRLVAVDRPGDVAPRDPLAGRPRRSPGGRFRGPDGTSTESPENAISSVRE